MMDNRHGGNIWPYVAAGKNKLLDFSASISPLPIPVRVKKILAANLDTLNCYPDPGSGRLKESLAVFHDIGGQNIIVGNGSIELIYLSFKAFKPGRALIFQPTFSEYEFAARSEGVKASFIRNTGLLKKNIRENSLVFLCNPNNPTGSLLPYSEILSVWKVCKENNAVLIVDEVFMDFVSRNKSFTMAKLAVKERNLLVLKSLTKLFGLAGLRVGYLIGEKETLKKLKRLQYPWNINLLAQLAGAEVVKDKEYIVRNQEIVNKERLYLFACLGNIGGINVFPSEANFLLCELTGKKIKSAADLSRSLLRKNILIRDCSNFRGLNGRFFRVSVKTRQANSRLVTALKDIFDEKS